MIEFVKRAFRNFLTVILWLNLIISIIVWAIAGYHLGFMAFRNPITEYWVIGGAIVGLIIGLLTNIIGGGFISTILNIDENLEELKKITIASS